MKQTMLTPNYLKEFSCIGGACEDSCCTGFSIPIEKTTYEKYKEIEEEGFKEKIQSSVTLNTNSTSPFTYASLNAKCGCPFQNENGLCSLQMSYGENMLSGACSKYPKQINAFEKQLERSATLSCPEIARLVLLKKEGLSFEQSEQEIDARDVVTRNLTKDMAPMVVYFEDLRIFSLSVLQDRTMDIQTRLLILQSFCFEMKDLVIKQKEEEIPSLIEQYLTQENTLKLEEMEINAGNIIQQIMKIREASPFNVRYEMTFNQMIDGLTTNFNAVYGEEFLNNHEYMLENYLVNYVFKHLFPFSYGADVYQAFQMLSLHAALIQLHLLGVGSYLREMNEAIAVRVIQSFTKEAEHSSVYLDTLFSYQF